MSEHTPGPWTWDGEVSVHADSLHPATCEKCGQATNNSTAGLVALIYSAGTGPLAANARLIAAAPDLLAALQEIVKGEGAFSRDPLQHCTNAVESMRAIARAAIAKAGSVSAPATAERSEDAP